MSLSASDVAYMEAHKDDSNAPEIIIAATLGLVISITGVALRLLARRRTNQQIQSDDWWIIVAVCMDIVFKASAYGLVPLGLGRHALFVTNFKAVAILGLANELLWIFVATPTKISILCLYNRLFNSRSLLRWSICIGLIVSAYSIAYGIALGLQVIPFQAQWTGEPAWYANTNELIGSVAALDVLTDVMIIASPIPQIIKLKLNNQRKRELMAVFGVGAIVIVFGIVRTVYTSITSVSDPSYNNAKCEIWSLLQPSIGVFSACLPCLRPLLPGKLGGSNAASRRAGASKVSKRRVTMDYEMFSQGKDGWRVDEAAIPRHTTCATHGSRSGDGPEDGIMVERNVEITYERNWQVESDHPATDTLPA